MSELQNQSDMLRAEAQQLLYELLTAAAEHKPINGRVVNRVVECIVGSSIMEVVSMSQAAPETKASE
jgi:hypothetical protein